MAKEDNLIPAKKGEVRNPYGLKGKDGNQGVHLKTLIQNIGNNIDWGKTTLKDKAQMKELYGKNAWKALTYVAFTKAMAGDTKAMDWLAKNGYGTNLDITSEGKSINIIIDSAYAKEPRFRTDNNQATTPD